MEVYSSERSITKKGTHYLITCDISKETREIALFLELSNELKYWTGIFTEKDILKLTSKAKSEKTFKIFAEMFSSAISDESDAVSLDILDSDDIEKLRRSRQTKDLQDSTMSIIASDVRYLVLNYHSDFDRVSYPLKLPSNTNPDMKLLARTFNRIRAKAVSQVIPAINFDEIEKIKSENIKLKNKIILLETERQSGAVDNESTSKELEKIRTEFNEYREETERKNKFMVSTIEELKSKLKLVNNLADKKGKTEKNEDLAEIVLEERIKYTEEIERVERLNEELLSELKKEKEMVKQQRVAMKKLKDDLEIAEKRYKLAAFGSVKKGTVYSSAKSVKSYQSVKSKNSAVSKGSINSKASYNSKNSEMSKKSYNTASSKASYYSRKTFNSGVNSMKSGGSYNNLYKKYSGKIDGNLKGLKAKTSKAVPLDKVKSNLTSSSRRSDNSNLKSKHSSVNRNYAKAWQVTKENKHLEKAKQTILENKNKAEKKTKKTEDLGTRIDKLDSILGKLNGHK